MKTACQKSRSDVVLEFCVSTIDLFLVFLLHVGMYGSLRKFGQNGKSRKEFLFKFAFLSLF